MINLRELYPDYTLDKATFLLFISNKENTNTSSCSYEAKNSFLEAPAFYQLLKRREYSEWATDWDKW